MGGFEDVIQCPAGVRGRGDPAGAKRRGGSPARPRTACAWNGNQQTSLTQTIKKEQIKANSLRKYGDFSKDLILYCLQQYPKI
ncbi:hypothetical protein ABE288_04575 [Bacillus salipaludis]|uniref:hypothetical protein n=1 Tax=Bacillus salipaludis TaxID=2547811 RepID=UPI003D21DC5E